MIFKIFFVTTVLSFLFWTFAESGSTSFRNFEISLKRQKRWGNNYGLYGHGQPPNFVPYIPNNNVAVGYPTAYGLGVGYVKSGHGYGNTGPQIPNPKSFPVRCINGGAHIGQCRLDDDAICVALGGTCVNSACCTTPFLGLLTTTTTTQTPLIVDGEVGFPKNIHEYSEEEDKSKDEDSGKSTEDSGNPSREIDEDKLRELSELSKLLELGRKAGLSTDSPIYAIFAGLLETPTPTPTSTPTPASTSILSTVTGFPEWSKLTTTTMSTTETTPQTTPKTTVRIRTTTDSEINSVESRSVEDSGDYGPQDYTKKSCDDGMRPIGPCNDDGSCPVDHSCQRGEICCYDYGFVMMNSVFLKKP